MLTLLPLLVLAAPPPSSTTAAATDAVDARVLVLDLQPGDGVRPDDAAVVTAAVASALAKEPGVAVTTQTDVKQLSSVAAERIACGADDGSCLAELAGALDVRRIVHGRVTRLGAQWALQLALFDQAAGRSSTILRTRDDVSDLVADAQGVVHELLGGEPAPDTSAALSPAWGAVVLGVGALVGGGAAVAGTIFNNALVDPAASRADKDFALGVGRWSVVGGAVAGTSLAAGGAALLVMSMGE